MSRRYRKQNLLLLLVFSILVSSFMFFALQKIKADSALSIQNSLQTVLSTVEKTNQLIYQQRKSFIEVLAASDEMITYTESLIKEHKTNGTTLYAKPLLELRREIKNSLDKYQDLGFFIINLERINIGSMRDSNIGKLNLIQQQRPGMLLKAFDGDTTLIPTLTSYIGSKESNKNTVENDTAMFMATPIYDKSNILIAVFALRLNPELYYSSITRVGRIGETGETYAFNQAGYLLSNSRFERHLVKANLLKPAQQSAFNLRIADPGGNILEGYIPSKPIDEYPLTVMATSATQYKSGFNLEGYRDYRGVKVVGAWTWDDEFEFGITSEIDYAEAFSPYDKTRNTLIIVQVVSLALGTILVFIISGIQSRSEQQIRKANSALEIKVQERTEELEEARKRLFVTNQELSILATTDELTKLYNRRFFEQKFISELSRAKRHGESLAIIIFDVDCFKQYNDHYGHILGDDCLARVANCLLKLEINKRPGDVIARYGGEEFIILLSNADKKYTFNTACRVREAIEQLNIEHIKTKVSGKNNITVSVGFAIQNAEQLESSAILVDQADQALYQAKALGRNRACEYSLPISGKNVLSINKINHPSA